MKKFPQITRNLKVRERRELADCAALTQTISALESELGERGRVLVRFSGTEAKLRLLVEGFSDEVIGAGLERLVKAAGTDLQLI